ncbi:hypothetical protein ZIOFF_070440 [Zingiber officinale]|uniref:Transketolase-like pyrimidine-binding domain-containing protein n=1 Tax=Zingiber officinale TaxID=94328 RepID=A0A8J5C5G1_ZINOF|nr:hypothetical protein ZIOFF_070440 [Zingiber officinale]
MAASSTVTAARALAGLSVSGICSPSSSHADRLSGPSSPAGFYLGSRCLVASSSSSSLRFQPHRRPRTAARRAKAVKASAVETLEVAATEALVKKSINTIRFLAIDAIEKANSGHHGLPMGCAPMGHILYDEVMKYNPKNPYWFNRDRFVLSAGHGCMPQYALLHLAGYDSVQIEDIKQFRQWGSRTPGHPENFETLGILRIFQMFDLVLGNMGWVCYQQWHCLAQPRPYSILTAIRISALCEAGVLYVMTNDSIGLGEDGPTHQPIEQLMSFRAMPNILMLRPADGNETAGAYTAAVLNKKRPSVLALSRQKLSQLGGTSVEGVEKGGYVISYDSSGNKLDLILIGTGSELEIAAKAADDLRKKGKSVRVVSLVSWELFDEQTNKYND